MKILSTLIFTLVLCIHLNSQELLTLIPLSPTVSCLMKFEEVPINNYTRQPDISIPFYSKKLDKNLNLSLKYGTLGIKINEISRWTSTGWSMKISGIISRTIGNVSNEFQKRINSSKKTGVLHNSDFWNYDNF
ncbi:hypothetical protein [Lutibacter sp.]